MSGVETRNISRDSLFLLAEIRLEDSQSEFRIKVRNLSPGGMLAEGSVPVVPGNRLKICLRNIGWVDGGVAWVQENRFGIAFDKEINAKLALAPAAQEQSSGTHGASTRSDTARFAQNSRNTGKLRTI